MATGSECAHTGVRGENRKERNPKAEFANGDHNHGDTNGDRNHLDTDGNRADYDTFTIFKRNLERPAQLQRMSISDGSGRSFYTFSTITVMIITFMEIVKRLHIMPSCE